MAACGSLRPLFENPLPENPGLLESLSTWNQIQPRNPIGLSNLTEIFGELHFKEKAETPAPSPSPPSPWSSLADQIQTPQAPKIEKLVPQKGSSLDSILGSCKSEYMGCPMHPDCFLSRNSESLAPPFTEGLGSESSDEVDSCKCDCNGPEEEKGSSATGNSARDWKRCTEIMGIGGSFRISKTGGSFPPPPITRIGKAGKPWIQFRSYREDGRFVLREVRIPTVEIMRASREDGRLKLHLVQSDEESAAEEEEEGEEREEPEEEGEEDDDC